MGTRSKLAAREQRRKEKRQRKDAQRAKYKAWRDAGINSKSRRALKHVKVHTVGHPHLMSDCGNQGCTQCYPRKTPNFAPAQIVPSYFRRHGLEYNPQ